MVAEDWKKKILKPRFIAIGIVAVLMLILILQNAGVITLRIFFWQVAMSGAIFFPLIFALGVLAGWLVHAILVRKRKGQGAKNNSSTS